MTLHYYFSSRFLKSFSAVFAVFFVFMLLIDLVNQMRWLDDSVSFRNVLLLATLNTPKSIYQILPLIMIISAVLLFVNLNKSSEFIIARGAGQSSLTTLAGPILIAGLLGLIIIGLFNPIVASTSKYYIDLREEFDSGGRSVFSIGREGLWLRQGDSAGQTVIHAERTNFDGTKLYGVSLLNYTKDGGLNKRIEAKTASLQIGKWELEEAKTWLLLPGSNPEETAQFSKKLELPSTLTQDQIRDRFGKPGSVSLWKLPETVAQLKAAGFSARRHQLWFQSELARPLFLMALTMVAAAFTMRPARLGGTGLSILSAILLGFGLHFIRNFVQILGENGQLPIFLSAWSPPIAALALAFGLMLQMEDAA